MSRPALRTRIRSLVSLFLFVLGMGVLCAVAQEAISVGVVLPVTGREGKPGQYQKEGIDLAIKQINDAGGVMVKDKGKKLPLKEIFYDDGSDSGKSASLTERAMSSDGVTAVIGGYSTALGEAESVMPDRYQTPWITPGAGATSIFSRGYRYIFGTLSPVA
ncbi:MAG: ABC transporter substrate-binding protein, partial [Candidatus Angelobacter sp.]